MKFWKISGILLLAALLVFLGFETFWGDDESAAGETLDALKLEVAAKDTLVEEYKARIGLLEDQIAELQKNQESAILVYARQTEYLEELLLAGAKAYKIGESVYTYIVENGEITLTGYLGNEEKVSVPDTIEGKRVTRIGKETFRESSVREVVVPVTVTYIDWFAFYGCFGLHSVTLPASVSKIEYGAFDGCSTSLTVRCEKGSYAERYAKSYGLSVTTE